MAKLFLSKTQALQQKFAFVAAVSAVFITPDLAAQSDREVVSQATEWFSASSTIKLRKSMALFVEGHARAVQQFDPMQFQLRTAFEVEINKHWSAYPLGYVYTSNPLYGKQPNNFVNNEHRIFEQIMYKHKISGAVISHRFRIEQRFAQSHGVKDGEIVYNGYNIFTNRFRYRFNATIPFNKPKIVAGSWFAAFYDEIFVSFGNHVTYHAPDQNRLFTGIGYSFTSHFSLQAGPFYQILIKAGGTKQENNIGAAVNLTYNIDLTRGE